MFYVVSVIHALFWLRLGSHTFISLLLFEMPAIFFCAGVTYGLQPLSTNGQGWISLPAYVRYLSSRAVRIMVPYWAYALGCLALMAITRDVPAGQWLQAAWAWLNPIYKGNGYSPGLLNWHLWFVPIYLLVVAALPVVASFGSRRRPHVAFLVIGVVALEYVLSPFTSQSRAAAALAAVICYLPFAWFGQHWHQQSSKAGLNAELKITAGVCLGILVLLSFSQGWAATWAMQRHKFLTDQIFFLFGTLWLSALVLLATSFAPLPGRVASCSMRLLSPFIRYGYSIYLWQGIGYWFAFKVTGKLGWHVSLTWLLAVVCSVVLGYLASPLERVRIRWASGPLAARDPTKPRCQAADKSATSS